MKRSWISQLVIALVAMFVAGTFIIQRLEVSAPDPLYSPVQHPKFPVVTPTGQPQSYEPSCQQPPSRDDADLCAQWASVEAVKQGNSLTKLSIWLTFFEFIALAASLFFSAWAALAASRATKASERSLALTEESAQAQVRPYVYFDATSVQIFDEDKPIRAQALLHLRNFGSTPAYEVKYFFLSNIVKLPLSDEFFSIPLIQIPPPRRMPPNHSRKRWTNITKSHYDQIMRGAHALLIKVEVTYKTGSGQDAATDFDRGVFLFDRNSLISGNGRAPRPYDFASGTAELVEDFIQHGFKRTDTHPAI